jgi:hypothetical protein
MTTFSSQIANSATVTVNASLFTRVYVGWDSFALSLVVMKYCEWEIPGVADNVFWARNGRRRSGRSFNLGMEDDVGSIWLGVG